MGGLRPWLPPSQDLVKLIRGAQKRADGRGSETGRPHKADDENYDIKQENPNEQACHEKLLYRIYLVRVLWGAWSYEVFWRERGGGA